MAEIAGYELGALLGEGAYGKVYAASSQGTPVAIKVITDPDLTISLQKEILAIAAMDHPNILRVFDFGTVRDGRIAPAGTPFLVTEQCSGGSLADRLPETYEEVRTLLEQLLDALSHAHAARIVHLDIKLANVLFATDRDLRPGLRLADFGLAGTAETASTAGTPLYMPPEQYQTGSQHIGPWSDLFALGVMAWRLVGGRPWETTSRAMLLQAKVRERFAPFRPVLDVPPGFEEWLKTLLAASWEARFLSAAAARQSLRGLEGGHDRHTAQRQAEEAPTEVASSSARASWDALPERPAAQLPRVPEQPEMLPFFPSEALTRAGRALLALREPSLIGRSTEQATLWRSFRDARLSMRGGSVRLTGSEGAGRARLARWLAQRAHHDAGAFTAVLDERPTPFGLIGRVLRVRPSLSELMERLKRLRVATPPVLQALEALELDPEQGQVGFRLALRVLGAVARRYPVVLALLDVDTDPDLAALGVEARTLGEALFVVETSQHGDGVEIGALTEAQLKRILQTWAPLHWRAVEELVGRSAGLPGRMVRAVKASRLLPHQGGGLMLDATPYQPPQLGPEQRRVATTLGLLGPLIRPEPLYTVLQGRAWTPLLHRLVRDGVLDPVEQGWVFRNEGIRETFARLEPVDAVQLNQISEALEAAGQHAQAVDRALDAGMEQRAADLFCTHCKHTRSVEAIRAFQQRLEEAVLRERVQGRLLVALVDAALRERHPETESILAEASGLAARLRWHRTAGLIAQRSWNYLRTPIEHAIEAYERAEPGLIRDWQLASCWMHVAIQEPSHAVAWERALTYAEACGRPFVLHGTRAMHALKQQGDAERAVREEELALADASTVQQQVSSIMYLQHYLLKCGSYDRVVQVGQQGIGLCELISNRQYLLFILLNTAMAHARSGSWDRAWETAARALALPRYPPSTGIARVICAVHQARQGDVRPGIELVPDLAELFASLFDVGDPDLFWLLERLADALEPEEESARIRAMITGAPHGGAPATGSG